MQNDTEVKTATPEPPRLEEAPPPIWINKKPMTEDERHAKIISYIRQRVSDEDFKLIIEMLQLTGTETPFDDIALLVSRWDKYDCLHSIDTLKSTGKTATEIYNSIESYIESRETAEKEHKFYKQTDEKGKVIREEFTIPRFEDFLNSLGFKVRLNVISAELMQTGFNPSYDTENLNANLPAIIYSEILQAECFKGLKTEVISRYISTIARKYCYNPVADMIQNTVWNGKDYLSELYEIMGISEEDTLSRTLIRKWLHQSLSLAIFNTAEAPFGADGCLTLHGKQGIGKTQLLAALGCNNPELYKEGQSITNDKDTKRRCLTTWLCELGEIEKTFGRMAPEDLKAFITQDRDEYRLPYAARDTKNPRRVSLYATCNSDDFLVDPTGSRRYWVIPVTNMKLDKILEWKENRTAVQLWKQIYSEYVVKDIQGFRLTEEEKEQLLNRNSNYNKKVDAQSEIEDYLVRAETRPQCYQFEWITASDLMEYQTALKRYGAVKTGKALRNLGIESKKRNVGTVYKLPVFKYRAE